MHRNVFKSTIRILIADHHAFFFRRGLRAFLEEQGHLEVVGEAGTMQELPGLCRDLAPDIVLLGLPPDGSNGSALTATLRKCFPHIRCIVFTASGDEEAPAAHLENWAGCCVITNANPRAILSAIRNVSANEHRTQHTRAGRVFEDLHRADVAKRERNVPTLTDRETQVLQLLAEGLRKSEIARRLFISHRTVKVHVANIFSKLELHDRVQAARYAIRAGLLRP